MALVSKAQYSSTSPSLSTDGEYEVLQVDRSGSLCVTTRPPWPETPVNVAGAASTTGLIGTVANAAKIYVACDCASFPVNYIDWVIDSDQQFTYQFYRANSNVLSATITLTDATAVDNTDTFVLNGITFTAVTSGAVAASHEFNLGASNAACAVNLAALLDSANGVPGIASATITSPTTTDVITLACDTATTLQFAQGLSASDEITYADTTLTGLYTKDAVSSNTAATTTNAGWVIPQTMNGWKWGYVCLTNTSGSAAATFVVNTVRY
jgi:hypothetical protein